MAAPRRADTWMPFYVADYLKDTMHLTTEQHGAYMLLLMACWSRGGSLPEDPAQLAGIARMPAAAWKRSAPVVLAFFSREGGELHHKRIAAELDRAQRLSEARREAGAKGGRPRKQDQSEPKPIGLQLRSQTETPSPSPSQREETSLSASAPAARSNWFKEAIPEGFPGPSDIADAERWIVEAGVKLDATAQSKRFRSHALSNNRKLADWAEGWRGWIGIECEKAEPAPTPKTDKRLALTWDGPQEVWDACARAMGEGHTRSYLGPSRWQADPPAILPQNRVAADELRKARLGVTVIMPERKPS